MADWFSKFAAQPNKSSGDWFAQFALEAGGQAKETSVGREVVQAGKTAVETLNPLPMLKAANTSAATALGTAASGDPVGAVKQVASDVGGIVSGIGQENLRLYNESREAFTSGDIPTGIRKGLNFLLNGIPGLGSTLDQASEDFEAGEPGKGTGRAIAAAAGIAAPEYLSRVRSINVPAVARNDNAAVREAVKFGQREGIPVDAGTATGNRFVAGTQAVADRSPIGSLVAENADTARAQALRATGERIAGRVNAPPGRGPGPAVTPEQAGQGVRDAVQGNVRRHHSEADAAYGRLRALEQQAAQKIATNAGQATAAPPTSKMAFTQLPLAVDMAVVKDALRPVYDRLMRQLPVTQQRSSPGLKAIENIINGPDMSPLSLADTDLSAIKSLARGADLPELRDVGQGVAAQAVKQLDDAVRAAALRGGKDVFDALMEGRKATTAKYQSADVLRQLREEPVQVFNQTIWQKDAGIERLRALAKEAPGEMPKLGRAYLDDLLGKATSQGGFDHAQGLWQQWQNMGPQTKKLMFKDPALVKDLDNFFLLAKKTAESPNPSGTALTAASWSTGVGLIVMSPTTGIPLVLGSGVVSKLLHSPWAVKLLTEGMRIPVGNKVAATTAATEILAAARQQGFRPVPVPAEDQTRPGSPTAQRGR